jgi:hypothetical protein
MAGEVVGREQELAAVGQFLEGHGLPSILLIEGEAGIGKTTLWRAVRNRKPNRRRRQPILSKPCFSPPATTRRASRAQARFNVSSCSSLVHVEAALRHLLVHLVVAYQGQKGKTRYNDATVRDPGRPRRRPRRGRFGRSRVAASWPPQNVSSGPSGPYIDGTFVPGGLVAVETFQFVPGYGLSPLIGAFVPFGP